MKNSKSLRKFFSAFLCVCISTFNLPVFAASADTELEFVKIELSNSIMSETVGANGSVDVKMSDHTVINAPVQAVLSNRTGLLLDFNMTVTDSNGVVLEVLQTGRIGANTAVLITGEPTQTSNGDKYQYVRTSITSQGIPALNVTDSSAAIR